MQPKISTSVLFLLLISSIVSGQNFIIGTENGVNFSNVRKSTDNDRMAAQPGPVNGMFFKYLAGDWIAFESGLDLATLYFEKSFYYYYYGDSYYNYSSSIYQPSSSYVYQSKFNFLRIPLLMKLRTPGRLNFEIGGGPYYAFLVNDEYRGKDKDLYIEEYGKENLPPLHDWGWILTGSVNYNIDNRWKVFLSSRVTNGKKVYFDSDNGKVGSTEILLGLGFNPFVSKEIQQKNENTGTNVKIIPYSGVNFSRTKSTENKSQYGNKTGFTSGVSLKFILGENFSLNTGALYERKGYSLNYEGNYNFIYRLPLAFENQNVPAIHSDVRLDYLTFPFGFEISAGKKLISNLSFGVYYSLLQNVFAEGEKINTNNYSDGYNINRDYFNNSLDHWFKKSDAGFVFGYRLEYPFFQWGNVFIAVQQSFGVNNIYNNLDELTINNTYYLEDEMYNNSTSILFGIVIPVSQN